MFVLTEFLRWLLGGVRKVDGFSKYAYFIHDNRQLVIFLGINLVQVPDASEKPRKTKYVCFKMITLKFTKGFSESIKKKNSLKNYINVKN